MKILLVIHVPLDPNAGASGVTLKLGEAYEKFGHDVYYYSHDDLPPWPSGKLATILFPYHVARHIRRLDRSIGLDVVHASSGVAWIWGMLFGRLGLGQRPFLITQSHGLEHTVHEQLLEEVKQGRVTLSWKYPLYNGSVLLWQVAKSFQVADCGFLLNQYDAETVKGRMGVAAEKVKVFPNAIPDEFVGLPFEPLPEADRLPEIAFVASYLDRKGIQYGVPALNHLMQRYPQLRVRFLGTGGTVEKVLDDFSPAVRDRVTVVPSFDKSELPRLLKDCHILLFPSLSEGFPLAVPEAMACGLAPIVTDIPGPTEIVVNGVNGLVVPPRDQMQLEQAMVQLIDDRACLQRLRIAAYETVQGYTWSNVAQQHLDLYSERLGRSRVANVPTAALVARG
jgi:glycosyltransferase involved in cell wall biosynthesis